MYFSTFLTKNTRNQMTKAWKIIPTFIKLHVFHVRRRCMKIFWIDFHALTYLFVCVGEPELPHYGTKWRVWHYSKSSRVSNVAFKNRYESKNLWRMSLRWVHTFVKFSWKNADHFFCEHQYQNISWCSSFYKTKWVKKINFCKNASTRFLVTCTVCFVTLTL